MSHIPHCSTNNPVTERWYLNDGTAVMFSQCCVCNKPLAVIIDIKTQKRISEIFGGFKKVLKTKEKCKKRLIYKDFETKSQRSVGFVFGLNIEIHDCKGRINKIRQRAKDFFGNQSLIREIDL